MSTDANVPTTPMAAPLPAMAAPLPPPHLPDVPEWVVPPEAIPNLDELVLEDGKPVDNIFAEKQQRLLTEPLYSSWKCPVGNGEFEVLANVGLFPIPKMPPLAPDVMLSLGVRIGADLTLRENRSYFLWELGKPPDVALELVSDRRGEEATSKMAQYARMGVAYYVIFDPNQHLGAEVLQSFVRFGSTYQPVPSSWFADVHLGVTLWEGDYEGHQDRWLRWCDEEGEVIPTGAELAQQERQRADDERQRADREAERAGREAERAGREAERAGREAERADNERQLRERLEARLRELGIEP